MVELAMFGILVQQRIECALANWQTLAQLVTGVAPVLLALLNSLVRVV